MKKITILCMVVLMIVALKLNCDVLDEMKIYTYKIVKEDDLDEPYVIINGIKYDDVDAMFERADKK